MFAKIIDFNVGILMQNFADFHAIESEIELSQEFGEKPNSSANY